MAARCPDFEAELVSSGMHADLVSHVMTVCGNSELFASYVHSREDCALQICNKCNATVDDRTQAAILVALWRKHDALVTRSHARHASGLPEADLEDPLEAPVKARLDTEFLKYYHFRLRAIRTLADPLIGRMKRENDRRTWTVLPANRARSQAVYSKALSIQRVTIGNELALDIGRRLIQEILELDLRKYVNALRLIMNGHAIVGRYEVPGPSGTVRAASFAPWDLCMEYVDFCEGKVFDSPFSPSVDKLRVADESTRELWCEWLRTEGLTMGECLERSKVQAAPFWLWGEQSAHADVAARENLHTSAPGAPRKRSAPLALSQYATETNRGKPICDAYNTTGGCAIRGCTEAHVCNFLLKDGKACGSQAHVRSAGH